MKKNILFISAGAGSGKTYRITEYLQEELDRDAVRPEAVIATTFTRKAAGELVERVRAKLVESGKITKSISMGQALIGTVNSVCGRLLARYAFEAGLSPELEVIEEDRAAVLFGEALEQALSLSDVRKMNELQYRLAQGDWKQEVRKAVNLARSNDISSSDLAAQARRSVDELMAFFPPPVARNVDDDLKNAIRHCIREIKSSDDITKLTANYLTVLTLVLRNLDQERLPWSDWVKLSKAEPAKRSQEPSEPVRSTALNYDRHPRLHEDIREWVFSIFELAQRAMQTYQSFKAQRGLMDFIDQEKQVLDILDIPDVANSLVQELDILMVDEFQDTSPIQLAVFMKLAGLAKKTVWVGDIKQAIYGFRGSDPALMNAVVNRLIDEGSDIEILPESWRSRPQLVHLTNNLFVPAFSHILDRKQVELSPALTEKYNQAALAFWTLDGSNQSKRASALAAGVAILLNEGRVVTDKETGEVRPLKANDIAVLSREHRKAAEYAHALAAHGIPISLKRKGLLKTPEACLALACLRYLTDPRDMLAVAEIVSLKEADNPEDWLENRLEYLSSGEPGQDWCLRGSFKSMAIKSLAENRGKLGLLSPAETLEIALQAGEVERSVIAWGPTHAVAMQRLANIEALRGYASEYEDACLKERSASTAGGFLIWLKGLSSSELDERGRDDNIEAVHILTHHAAKGLEWPVVVSADLETGPRSGYWGFSILSGNIAIDVESPLKNRTIRYWVKPFGQQSTNIAVYDAINESHIGQDDQQSQTAEAIRLLYVSFTRARDLLILPLSAKSTSRPWLDSLRADWLTPSDPELTLPDGQKISCTHKVLEPSDDIPAIQSDGKFSWHPARIPRTPKLPAVVSPSDFEMIPEAAIGNIITVGPRLTMRGKPDMQTVGDAFHAIIASSFFLLDRPEKREMTERVLKGYHLTDFFDVTEVVAMTGNLQETLNKDLKAEKFHPEWPIRMVQKNGQLIKGWIDLAVEIEGGWIVVDHKSFPGGYEKIRKKALDFSGQLAAYTGALEQATGKPAKSQWIHFSIAGKLVEVILN